MFDGRWEKLVTQAGLRIKLYMRYMDDGRTILQPERRGWRWILGELVYCKRWELEDESRTTLDTTLEILKDSMRGVMSYLTFTYESGQDY